MLDHSWPSIVGQRGLAQGYLSRRSQLLPNISSSGAPTQLLSNYYKLYAFCPPIFTIESLILLPKQFVIQGGFLYYSLQKDTGQFEKRSIFLI
jgi:hypothetical protein